MRMRTRTRRKCVEREGYSEKREVKKIHLLQLDKWQKGH
jgi:hypothetical protein